MSDVNLILYLMRDLFARSPCLNSVCSAFYVTRKVGRPVILRLLGPLEVCAGARQHGSAPDFDRTAGNRWGKAGERGTTFLRGLCRRQFPPTLVPKPCSGRQDTLKYVQNKKNASKSSP